MSGLFRRLAERANGQRSPVLHATVLPVTPIAGDWLPEVDPLPWSAPVTSAPPASQTTAVHPPAHVVTPTAHVNAHEQATALVPSPRAYPRETASRPVTPAPGTPTCDPTPQAQPQPDPMTPVPVMTAVMHTSPSPEIERPAPAPTCDAPRLPTPLLACRSSSGDQPPPVTPFNPPSAPPVADEIHVHIGRIEVTALHEALPAKQQIRTPQPSLSLDDYLARRKGERP